MHPFLTLIGVFAPVVGEDPTQEAIQNKVEDAFWLLLRMVRPARFERATPTMSRWYSNQLSYGRSFNSIIYRLPTNSKEIPL